MRCSCPAVGRCGLVVLLTLSAIPPALTVHGRQPGDESAVAEPPAAPPEAGLTVPELPADASPRELLEFVSGLMPPKQQPRSRDELFNYVRGVSELAVKAADRVIAEVKEDEALYAEAARLKLQSLLMLGRLGAEQATADFKAFATKLAASPVPPLAMEAKRMLVMADAQEMLGSGDFSNAGAIVARAGELLREAPDDPATASMAMQFVQALEQVPGGSEAAVTAMKTFGPIFETSTNERIRGLSQAFEGKLRFMSLPGNPMEISGTLLDGKAFDPATLAGKVVLVDFWATWCGPCVAEIPNMLAEYEKYHEKGFEIVGISLDQDRAALEAFVTERKIPWPVLHEQDAGGGHPLAEFYGINGIPQFVLIGRDGNVITLDVRGEKLGQRLAELFKDAG
jgi:thiol-disulfide isomerase/thioredoxin